MWAMHAFARIIGKSVDYSIYKNRSLNCKYLIARNKDGNPNESCQIMREKFEVLHLKNEN